MNRQIKFRVWDIKLQKWLKNCILWVDTGAISYPEIDDLDTVILFQSTDIKDSNGKEIFEGDILEISQQILKVKDIVKFKEGAFRVGGQTLGSYHPGDLLIVSNSVGNQDFINKYWKPTDMFPEKIYDALDTFKLD